MELTKAKQQHEYELHKVRLELELRIETKKDKKIEELVKTVAALQNQVANLMTELARRQS